MVENKKTVLITGSNRGIGFGLVKEFINRGYNVIATCRHPDTAHELMLLADNYPNNMMIEKLDVVLPIDFQQISEKYKANLIDIIVNNAGIFPEKHSRDGIESSNPEDILNAFDTNSLGSLRLIQAFQSNLLKSTNPRVINISSQMGALSSANGFCYSYRMSKVALNMLTRCFAAENKQIITISLRPGWVKTELGGTNASISIEESAVKMINLIENLQIEDSGFFYDSDKNICSW